MYKNGQQLRKKKEFKKILYTNIFCIVLSVPIAISDVHPSISEMRDQCTNGWVVLASGLASLAYHLMSVYSLDFCVLEVYYPYAIDILHQNSFLVRYLGILGAILATSMSFHSQEC